MIDGAATHRQRVVAPTSRARQRMRDLVGYRELLGTLTSKQLKVRYKSSSLGFVWSLVNPVLQLLIYWLVFTKFLGRSVPHFAIYFLSGLVVWTLFASSVRGAATSIVGNARLVTKVFFPREILPLSTVAAQLAHFCLQFCVLVVACLGWRTGFNPEALILIPFALLVTLVFASAMALLVSVLNVYFRDVQHLLEMGMVAWFWMTPIAYPVTLVLEKMPKLFSEIYFLNPMVAVVNALRRGVYGPVDRTYSSRPGGRSYLPDAGLDWHLLKLAIAGAGSLVLLGVAWGVFRRLESRLAEEL